MNASDLHTIPGLASVDEVVLEQNLDGSRQLARRCSFWHFLERDHLRPAQDGSGQRSAPVRGGLSGTIRRPCNVRLKEGELYSATW